MESYCPCLLLQHRSGKSSVIEQFRGICRGAYPLYFKMGVHGCSVERTNPQLILPKRECAKQKNITKQKTHAVANACQKQEYKYKKA